jgi:replicative DNA helicase
MKPLQDIAAERAVLAGVCQFGSEVYLDIADIVQESTFTVQYNKFIFASVKRLFEQGAQQIDISSILSAGQEIGLQSLFDSSGCYAHITSLFNCAIAAQNTRKLAAKIRKLEIARLLETQLDGAKEKIREINGDETVTQILGIAENAIFDFSSLLTDREGEPHRISENLVDYVDYLASNPVDQIGIPTGFKLWDQSVGGGLRKGTVNVFGARIKTGKSMLASNMGWYIADTHNIPVLNMDTEMTEADHTNRLLAMASECYTYDIETGKFVQKPGENKKVRETAQRVQDKGVPYYHISISGMPFEEQLSVLRRWIVKNVGLDSEGKAKPCVIVYDYLKLMTSEGMGGHLQEYQLLGFMMTSLHNFAVRYGLPIVCFIQLNRDGIENETSASASGSDRIVWLCSNYSILKKKSDEEIAQDGPENGNRKLVVVETRHGQGRDSRDYINCHFRGEIAKIVEGRNNYEVQKEKDSQEASEYEDDSNQESSGNYSRKSKSKKLSTA